MIPTKKFMYMMCMYNNVLWDGGIFFHLFFVFVFYIQAGDSPSVGRKKRNKDTKPIAKKAEETKMKETKMEVTKAEEKDAGSTKMVNFKPCLDHLLNVTRYGITVASFVENLTYSVEKIYEEKENVMNVEVVHLWTDLTEKDMSITNKLMDIWDERLKQPVV